MTPTEKQELQVDEEQDGSAVVQLPEGEAPPNEEAAGEGNGEEHAEGGEVEVSASNLTDDEREAIRAARREERRLKKQIHKEKARESNHLITALRKQNGELAERLAVLERKTSGAELARVDKAIEDTAVQVEYANMKMREAMRAQDGDNFTKAQEAWYEAQRKLEALTSLKQRATQQMAQPAAAPTSNKPDPIVAQMASAWVGRNSWYNPQGDDLDSQITQSIDKKLTEEGFDPSSEEYWDELDARVKRYLPHRANAGHNGSGQTQRPRAMVTSSGRESAGTTSGNTFRLSPERVAALKEAGMWENPDLRNKAIRKYAEWDRQNKQRGA